MFRIDSFGTKVALEAPAAPGATVGYFTEGNPLTATPATVVSAEWLNTVQEELIAVAIASGVVADKANRAQVLAAIRWLQQNDKAIADFVVANNTAAADVTNLIFDKTIWRSAIITFNLYRKTDTPVELSSVVRLVVQYKPVLNTWSILQSSDGDDCEVNFTITAAGQVKYTSTNIAGANYVGSAKGFKIERHNI